MVKKKRAVKKSYGKSKSENSVRATKRKLNLVIKNLIFFFVLFIVSFLLYTATSNRFLEDLFLLAIIIFAFIDIAFLIVFLVLIILKSMKR